MVDLKKNNISNTNDENDEIDEIKEIVVKQLLTYHEFDKKQIIAITLASVIVLAIGIVISCYIEKYDSETSNSVVTETNNSITCIVEDVGKVQNVDTKPDSRIIVDSDGKSNVVYGGSSQEISLSYYVYLKDSNDAVFQFSVSEDVYAAMLRKKGDTITISLKKDWFGNAYYWQGEKLSHPLQMTESSEQNITTETERKN